MKKILFSLLLFLISGCNSATQYGTLPYDDSKTYPAVSANAAYDIIDLMKAKGYDFGQYKALPLARVAYAKERYLSGPRDIIWYGWITSIKTNDNHIFYLRWANDLKPVEIKEQKDVIWLTFLDDVDSNVVVNRKPEARRIDKGFYVNWIGFAP